MSDILQPDPIYWEAKKSKGKVQEWQKGVKSNQQDKTPLRVVYIEGEDDQPRLCGVMTHSEVEEDFKGEKYFKQCD